MGRRKSPMNQANRSHPLNAVTPAKEYSVKVATFSTNGATLSANDIPLSASDIPLLTIGIATFSTNDIPLLADDIPLSTNNTVFLGNEKTLSKRVSGGVPRPLSRIRSWLR